MKALELVDVRRVVVADIPEPGEPTKGEAIVRIEYVSLNHLDLYGYRGMAFAKRELPMTMGVEASGVVEAVGPDVRDVHVGEHVVVYPAEPCGVCKRCRAGRDTLCTEARSIMGFHRNGLAAERVRVKARQLLRVPHGVSLLHAACTPITLATVEQMLFDNARLENGETVLIHAAGSGIGSTAVRMAKARGATVIATVGNDWKAEKAREIGADDTINYSREPFHSVVRKLTQKRGVDVVFEHVGEATWERSLLCLAHGGRLVTCGSTSGTMGRTNLLHLVTHQLRIIASFGGTHANVNASLAKLARGEIEPVIDSVLTMEQADDAFSRIEKRDVFGKLLLRGFGKVD